MNKSCALSLQYIYMNKPLTTSSLKFLKMIILLEQNNRYELTHIIMTVVFE